jgi:hypothetical protein
MVVTFTGAVNRQFAVHGLVRAGAALAPAAPDAAPCAATDDEPATALAHC